MKIAAASIRVGSAQLARLDVVPVVIFDVDEAEALALSLLENLQREDLNSFEETLGILDLLALELGKTREEVVGLLHRMRNETKGRVTRNVTGNAEAEKIAAVFHRLGRMSWESFVRNRLPLLTLPDDLKGALEAGAIPYTAALELKKVEDDGLRRSLLDEVKAGMSLRALREKVKELLEARREAAPKTATVYVPASARSPASWAASGRSPPRPNAPSRNTCGPSRS